MEKNELNRKYRYDFGGIYNRFTSMVWRLNYIKREHI